MYKTVSEPNKTDAPDRKNVRRLSLNFSVARKALLPAGDPQTLYSNNVKLTIKDKQ